jgi:NitT/TauT family transport system permease protein
MSKTLNTPALASTPPDVALDLVGPSTPRSERLAKGPFEWSRVIGPLVLFGIFIGVWYFMHSWGMRHLFDKPGFLLPTPHDVWDKTIVNGLARRRYLEGLQWTSIVAFGGLGLTIVVGVLLAVVMSQAKWLESSAYPYLVALQAIPVLAVIPLLASVFGGGLAPRFFVCFMISFFPIVTNTLFGLNSAEVGQHDLFTLRKASRWTRLMKLQLPAAMPAIFTGFRISAGLSVIGAIVGEQFFRKGSKPGVGIVMDLYRSKGIYPQVYGGLIIACLLGIATFLAFGGLSKLVVGKWYETGQRRT